MLNSREEKNYHQDKKPWQSPQATSTWIKKLCHPSETNKLYFKKRDFKPSWTPSIGRSLFRQKKNMGSQPNLNHNHNARQSIFLILPSARKKCSSLHTKKFFPPTGIRTHTKIFFFSPQHVPSACYPRAPGRCPGPNCPRLSTFL